MSYLVLARKYRPQTFEQVLGQGHITRTLQNAIKTDRVAHALLFSGPRGVGKTSVARIMAKALNCDQGPTPTPCNTCASCQETTDGIALDVMEIDGASNRGINEIRELRENIKYMPSRGRYKIYIIDEVHMLTTEAFNALLKTLEEPPAHVLFFFATTEPHKIPITILSRCQRHNFRRIPLSDIVGCLKDICKDLSFQISNASLHILAREATGGLRDALSMLDQVMAYTGDETSDEEVLQSLGVIDQAVLFDLSRALFEGQVAVSMELLEKLYTQGHDMKRLYRQMLGHLRHLLMVKMNSGGATVVDALEEDITLMRQQIEAVSLEVVHQIFTTWFEAENSIRFSSQPKLALEILFIKLGQFKNVVSFDTVLKKMDDIAKRLDSGVASPIKGDSSPPVTVESNPPVEDNPSPLVTVESNPPVKDDPSPSKEKKTDTPSRDHTSLAAAGKHSATLGQTWEQLLSIFQERCKALLPCLEKASLKKVGEDFLEITIEGNSFFAARLRDQKSRETIQSICCEFFGKSMNIRIEEKKGGKPQQAKHDDNAREARLKREALDHPVVTDALEVFEGRVVEVKITGEE